eukprot:7984-Chlamydomonas_euryale.AAC.1
MAYARLACLARHLHAQIASHSPQHQVADVVGCQRCSIADVGAAGARDEHALGARVPRVYRTCTTPGSSAEGSGWVSRLAGMSGKGTGGERLG